MHQRNSNRWPQTGTASAMCLSTDLFGQIFELVLLDLGPGGMGARHEFWIEPGTQMTLGFSMAFLPAQQGVVVACTPMGQHFRVAIRFEEALAQAA